MSILVDFEENVDFSQKFQKMSNWIKFANFSILVKIFEKSRFWSKLSKILNFGQHFRKFVDFSQYLQKS